MNEMGSELYMFQAKARKAVVHTANDLFERKWKVHRAKNEIEQKTASFLNVKKVEPYVEAMILGAITHECKKQQNILLLMDQLSVVFGNFVVHCGTIDGLQCSLPTLGIFTA